MSSAPHVVPIFATPFGVVSLPALQEANEGLANLFTARALPAWHETGARTPPTTFRSRDDLMQWPEAPVQLLLRELLAGVSSVVTAISDLTPEQFAALRLEARSWFTIIGTDGYLAPENQPNTSWTAVYCVTAPPASPVRQDSGVLRLHEFRSGAMFMDAAQGALRIPYRPGHCTWRPVAGQMAVFPGTITHEVALLRGTGPLVLVMARVRYVHPEQPWMPPW
jgi:hypothetical protein